MNYQDIYVVEDFDEAEQFRYEHNNKTVEVGTPVGHDRLVPAPLTGAPEGHDMETVFSLVCFDGIYYHPDE